jgi:hypothetical protein
MKSKISFYIFIIFIGTSVILVGAQVTTNTLIDDSDVVDSGFLVYYQFEIDHSDTTLSAFLTANVTVDFVLYEDDEWEDYLDGGSNPSWLVYHTDITSDTITTTLDKGIYYIVIINWGVSDCSYGLIINVSYDTSINFGDNLYIIIGIIVVLFIIIGGTAFARSRRRREAPVQYQTQTPDFGQYQPIEPASEYTPPSTEQPIFEAKSKGMQICPNCGADEDATTKFCTNCGSKLGN